MASPFEDFEDLHGSTPEKINAAADKPGVSATMLAQLGDDLLQDAKASDTATEGDLKKIAAVPKVAAGHAHTLAGAGQLAAGCLRKFGAQAKAFDTLVADLNDQVLHAPDPYVHDPDYRTGKVKVDFGQIRKNKEHELRPRYNRLVARLDSDADEVAAMLKGGPKNLHNIKTLVREGFIPLTAVNTFPGLELTPADEKAFYASVIALGPFAPLGFAPTGPGDLPGAPDGLDFVVGPPTRPDIDWDDDFDYGTADPSFSDYVHKAEWLAKLRGGQLIRGDLDDATQMYRHYWDNDGR